MLTVYHLSRSQSERVIWLCEELRIPYDLKRFERDPRTMLAPHDYRELHPMGAAPVIADNGLTLAESAAIVDYIIATHGDGRLTVSCGEPGYVDYLYWFHFVNGTLQPAVGRALTLSRAGVADDSQVGRTTAERLSRALSAVEARLGGSAYLSGDDLSAADIMIVFTLTTMRYFMQFDLKDYHNILAYLQRIAARPAYRSAMEKGDPGMKLLLT